MHGYGKTRLTVSVDTELALKLDAICEKYGKIRSRIANRVLWRFVTEVEDLGDLFVDQFLVPAKEGSK
jgi:predicted transcriptional regulator